MYEVCEEMLETNFLHGSGGRKIDMSEHTHAIIEHEFCDFVTIQRIRAALWAHGCVLKGSFH